MRPAKLNDPAKGVSGFVARGLKNANVPVWTSFLLGYGGGFVDDKGKLITETPAAIDCREDVQDAAREDRAAGRGRLQLERVAEPVRAGQGRDVARRHRLRAPLEDPTKSRIVGKVGYGVMPPGPKAAGVGDVRRRPGHLVVSARRRDRRGCYLQWASNKTNQARLLQAAAGAPVRNSAYADAEALAALKVPQGVGRLHAGARSRSRSPGLPIIVPVTEFRDIFGIALTNMINGADAAAELKKATAEFQPVLDKSEKS